MVTAKMYANVIIFFRPREIMHVGHETSDREIELGNVPAANTIRVVCPLISVDFKLYQKFCGSILVKRYPHIQS